MTVKQLAQRIGVEVKQLDFELDSPCKDCRKLGGSNEPCEECMIVAVVNMRQEGV
jgi:hypothetical protein